MVRYIYQETDGINIFYREAGDRSNPALLLLHGFPSSSHMYRNLILSLSEQFYLIAPDYPGFGNSSSPPVDEFDYSFQNISRIIERFIEEIGLKKFSLYMQDYGGPVGFRIASRSPGKVEKLIIQNANAYEEGITDKFRNLIGPLWSERNEKNEKAVLELFEIDGTRFQYQHGTRSTENLSPDAWNMDQYFLNRPGNKLIQLELQSDYYTNLEQYPVWQEYLRKYQPPTLVVWGRNDPLFGEEGAEAYASDLSNIEIHLLDTGHFALEEDLEFISEKIKRFFNK